MKKSRLFAASIAALLMAGGVALSTTTLNSQSVAAASNIRQRTNYTKRSNAYVNTKGAKGIANLHYKQGSTAYSKTYRVTAGTTKGAKWTTAFYLPLKNLTSKANPSHKNTSYFATNAPQGFTMDKSGNMYFAFSRKNSNRGKTGYLYNGYIMKVDAYAVKKLKGNRKLLTTNPNSLIKSGHVKFSNMNWAFCSGSLAWDPKTNRLKFLVAYNNPSASFLRSHPEQMVSVNPSSLKFESTYKFYLHDTVTGQYSSPNVLAFDNNGNYYTVAAAQLNTSHGNCYIIHQGVRQGNGYSDRELGMTIKPILSTQEQGISIDNDRFYITSNSAYISFSLSKYLKNAFTPSMAGSAGSWLGVETAQLAGARESENVVARNGVKYMAMTWPNEVVMHK